MLKVLKAIGLNITKWMFPTLLPFIFAYYIWRMYSDDYLQTECLFIITTFGPLSIMAFWSWWQAARKDRLTVVKQGELLSKINGP